MIVTEQIHPLRSIRESRGLSLESVASAIAVTRMTIWNWESGKAPDIKNAMLLAQFYGVPVEKLFAYLLESDE